MPKNDDIEKKAQYRKQQKATLRMLQSLPLGDKVRITQELIDEAIAQYSENHIYLSFSGGKDSTVLSHIARMRYPNILHVFCDTSCEYPETIAFVHAMKATGANMITISPFDRKGCPWTFKRVVPRIRVSIIYKGCCKWYSHVPSR